MTSPATLPVEHLERRHRHLARHLAAVPVDGLLITSRPNIQYLSHFSGSTAWLLADPDRLTLMSDSRYAGELALLSEAIPRLESVVLPPGGVSTEEAMAARIADRAPLRLGFESASLTVSQHQGLLRRVAAAGAEVEWVPIDGAVEELRMVKDAYEIGILRDAAARLSDVSKCIIPNALAGVTERALAALIEWEMRQKGFDKLAFDTIVASGPNAALPHHKTGDRPLAPGDLVVVDFGGMYRGYAVDMTRTVTIGTRSARQTTCLEAVFRAHQAAFEAARVGTRVAEVDGAARSLLAAAGMGDAFSHSLGHGLGLEVHERPRLAQARAGVPDVALAAGMVFTIEPGVYFAGWGGVRIEDDAVVTEAGPEWLTEPLTAV
jgi:Xaa-Pro aminopeptidase